MGYHPPLCNGGQSENITFHHPSDAGGNKEILLSLKTWSQRIWPHVQWILTWTLLSPLNEEKMCGKIWAYRISFKYFEQNVNLSVFHFQNNQY